MLRVIGLAEEMIDQGVAGMADARILPTADRAVTGVLTNMVQHLDFWALDDDNDQ